MAAVYPRGPAPVPEAPPFDEPACVSGILALREARPITKVLAGGKLIHVVGGTTADIGRVWDEIETERKAFAAVPLQKEADYTLALETVAEHLDPAVWVAGMRDKLGVGEIVAPKEL